MPRTSRTTHRLLATLLAVLMTAGCTTAVAGRGRPAPVGSVEQVRTAAQLARFLMPLPAGAEPGDTDWSRNRTPTVDEYAEKIYSDQTGVDGGQYLRDLGVKAIAHEAWYVPGGDGADLALLLFDTPDAARNWSSNEQNLTATAGVRRGKLTSVVTAVGYTFTRREGDAYLDTRWFVVRGRIGVQVDYFNPGDFEPDDIDAWIATQYDRLG